MQEQMTYKQAAEYLGMAYITIREAVSRGSLTKCSTSTNTALLLKEQLALFKGKGRITKRVLSVDELALWEGYKREAENPTDSVQPTMQEVEGLLDSKLYDLKEGMNGLLSRLISPSYMDTVTRGHL